MDINWVDPLLGKAKEEAARVDDEMTKKCLMEGLGILEDNKDTLQYLGEQGFKSFIGLIGMGKQAEARAVLLDAVMDPEALIADADDAAGNIMDSQSLDWEEVATKIINGLGDVVVRVLASVLLTI